MAPTKKGSADIPGKQASAVNPEKPRKGGRCALKPEEAQKKISIQKPNTKQADPMVKEKEIAETQKNSTTQHNNHRERRSKAAPNGSRQTTNQQ
jgi:hypothetical protein